MFGLFIGVALMGCTLFDELGYFSLVDCFMRGISGIFTFRYEELRATEEIVKMKMMMAFMPFQRERQGRRDSEEVVVVVNAFAIFSFFLQCAGR